MLLEFSFARHQRFSSVNVSRHLSIFGKYSSERKALAWATKASATRESKAESVLGIAAVLRNESGPAILFPTLRFRQTNQPGVVCVWLCDPRALPFHRASPELGDVPEGLPACESR